MNKPAATPRNPNFADEARAIFEASAFTRAMGFELLDTPYGGCSIRMVPNAEQLQQHGFIHGGVLAALADHTAGTAATTVIAADQLVLTAELKVNYLRAGAPKPIVCHAEVIRPGRQLVFTEARIYQEADDRLLLTSQLTMAVQPKTSG